MGKRKSKSKPEQAKQTEREVEADEVHAFVDRLMRDLEEMDPDRREEQRVKAAELAGAELDASRLQLDEARKICSTRTGAMLLALGLGRPKVQGGRAGSVDVVLQRQKTVVRQVTAKKRQKRRRR